MEWRLSRTACTAKDFDPKKGSNWINVACTDEVWVASLQNLGQAWTQWCKDAEAAWLCGSEVLLLKDPLVLAPRSELVTTRLLVGRAVRSGNFVEPFAGFKKPDAYSFGVGSFLILFIMLFCGPPGLRMSLRLLIAIVTGLVFLWLMSAFRVCFKANNRRPLTSGTKTPAPLVPLVVGLRRRRPPLFSYH